MTIIFKIKPEENYRIAIKNLKLLLPWKDKWSKKYKRVSLNSCTGKSSNFYTSQESEQDARALRGPDLPVM
jgi:hypothetical protein